MADQLSKLTKRADAVAESASVLVSRAIREIRGEMANLSRELNLAGNADDRDRVYDMIRRKMNRLGRNLNRLLVAQNQAAAQGAAKAASDMTGLEIKYSAQRAKAICELVTPAQGENLAAVFTDKMGANMISTLREATVSALRQQAVAGGSMKELSRDMTDRWFEAMKGTTPVFTDAGGHEWNTATYFQMNVRTNTMRVYNDCLVDNVARETGSDLMRISTGGDPSCPGCFPWEGCIISVSGKTKGFPTYEDARNAGCFHPNCVHTLEYVDETADADEIALQKSVPADPGAADDMDAQDERRYEIDQARKMRDDGMTAEEARVAVDRDNLEASIRHGLLREDAAQIVAQMTDAQVTRLCPNGNPPEFVPAKGSKRKPEPEVWNHGRRGGVVHIKKDADLAHILSVTKADKAPEPPKTPAPAPKPAAPTPTPQNPPNPAPVATPKPPDVKTPVPKTDAPQGVSVPEFKTAAEAEKFIKDTFDVSAVGLKVFDAAQQRGIAEAARDAFANGCNKHYLRFVSTGQAMFADAGAKQAFLDARKVASASDVLGLFNYRLKGIKKGYTDTDAEWYGICQDLKATGKTVAHCVSWHSNEILKQFNGIYFNQKAAKDTDGAKCVASGWWVPGADTIKGTMAHELGHAIDKSLSVGGLRLCEQQQMRKIYSSMSKDERGAALSRYGASSSHEFIAEAWCEYTCSPNPRPLAKQIGDLIKSKIRKA